MSYNNKYNTRTSGRYNTPGQFVAAGELPGGAAPGGQRQQNKPNLAVGQPFQPQSYPAQPPLPPQPAPQRQATPQRAPVAPRAQPPQTPQPPHTPHTPQAAHNTQAATTTQASPAQLAQKMNPQPADVEMKSECPSECSGESTPRPHWMKNKLAGVKKISNKERRRRQNENLRRLLTPKNALMVLNEMMPNEQLATQFKVEPAASQFYKAASAHSFCADLTLDGNIYKGYGENKLSARNAAAEKAIRDLIIKRMTKAFTTEVKEETAAQGTAQTTAAQGTDSPAENSNGETEETLPMIQLASFALHKLFSEWEYEGIKVPQLKGNPAGQQQQGGEQQVLDHVVPTPPKPKPPMKRKELPPNAASLHPSMLLTYMRPGLEYRELAVTGDKPQTMLFTMGVDVDGATYIGKASNKKEARRQAARSACVALFGVQFPDAPAPMQQEL